MVLFMHSSGFRAKVSLGLQDPNADTQLEFDLGKVLGQIACYGLGFREVCIP